MENKRMKRQLMTQNIVARFKGITSIASVKTRKRKGADVAHEHRRRRKENEAANARQQQRKT